MCGKSEYMARFSVVASGTSQISWYFRDSLTLKEVSANDEKNGWQNSYDTDREASLVLYTGIVAVSPSSSS